MKECLKLFEKIGKTAERSQSRDRGKRPDSPSDQRSIPFFRPVIEEEGIEAVQPCCDPDGSGPASRPTKAGHHVDATVALDACRHVAGLRSMGDQIEAIAEPLDRGVGGNDRSLGCIG